MKIINKTKQVKDLAKTKQNRYYKLASKMKAKGLSYDSLSDIVKKAKGNINDAFDIAFKDMNKRYDKELIKEKEATLKDLKSQYRKGSFKGRKAEYDKEKALIEKSILQDKLTYDERYTNKKTNVNYHKNNLKLENINYEIEKQKIIDKSLKAKSKIGRANAEKKLKQLEANHNKIVDKLETKLEKALLNKEINNAKGLLKERVNSFGFKLTIKDIKEFEKAQKKANGKIATELRLAKTHNKELYDLVNGNIANDIKEEYRIDIRADKKFTERDNTTFDNITSKRMYENKLNFYNEVNKNPKGITTIVDTNIDKITGIFSAKYSYIKGIDELRNKLLDVGKQNPMAYYIWYQNNKVALQTFYDDFLRGTCDISDVEREVNRYYTELISIQDIIKAIYK